MGTRKAGRVYDVGTEPDPRFSLANERTFLAWVRTAMALMAGGIALHSLTIVNEGWLRSVLAIVLILLGAACTAGAYVRWRRVERAMRLREPLPPFNIGAFVTVAVVIVALILAIVVVL